ncbi:MAG TPA: polyphosphate kinase 1 [Candidatus Dormibacteraeota bacterium]|jgi:polyphosphate kinase|nr:polyphosphate kinase 1 [Candidatus Dormibacteraeota bacterium]
MARVSLEDPRYYLNRHVQWLEFNRRVLEEARDPGNPLLERVKFLAITANNLDEFVEVRVSSFLQEIEQGTQRISPDGLTAEQELAKVTEAMHVFVRDQYKCWNEELLPALAKQSIRVLSVSELDAKAAQTAKTFYERRVYPMLTPVTVDPSHPFPHVLNKALCISFLLRRKRGGNSKPFFGVVTVPRALPRLLRVPAAGDAAHYVFLHDIISAYAPKLYRGYEILASAPFRITRNSNLYLEEEETRSLLDAVDSQVAQRRKGWAVRLEIESGAHPDIVDRLAGTFELDPPLVFRVNGPVNLQRLFHLYEETQRPDLKYLPFSPRQVRIGRDADSLFNTLRRQDVLLHHPYDSYDPVVNFLETAAHDPRVLSIKQTLYRTSSDSPIAQALLEAAGKKEVTVVVELKASFDEASNIRWARSLEDAGVQVFHGLVGLKTHAKLALVVRHDPDGKIRRYAHLGTGNYNPSTARFYTDFSLFTRDDAITSAVHDVFNFLTAYAEQPHYKPLMVAPTDLAKTIIALIDRETRHAKRGRSARIIAKFNALLDPPVIQALYRASQAGVEIDLIVRGQCALVPGLRGISSRIRVRSIVGRFLEHSRIFYFENGSNPDLYLGSADWMPRNLYARVEVLFPVKDTQLRERICNEVLAGYLSDTRKARLLEPTGCYARPRSIRNGHGFSVQEYLMNLAQSEALPLNGNGSAKRSSQLKELIYTSREAASSSDATTADPPSQESSNAAV